MLEEQLTIALTTEICQLHASIAGQALAVFQTAAEIGEKLGEADDCPGFDFEALPFDAAQEKRYRNAHARRNEIEENPQLMLELLSLPEARERKPLVAGPAIVWAEWMRPMDRFQQWIRKRTAEMPVDEWPEIHRSHLRDRLKPIVELYQKL